MESDSLSVERIAEELRRSGNVGDAFEDFELAVAKAFELLGFRAEHLGGKGRTDVLLQAELSSSERYRVIVDAKSSASGVITDNAVKFDALKDHLKKHRADYGVVVGPDFAGRVKEWATNNKFNLFTIEDLIGLVERQQHAPLTVNELRQLFMHPDADLSTVEDAYDQAGQTSLLVAKILDMLYQEANDEDPIADGYMSLENLHFAIRKELSPRPTRDSVDSCLDFLSSHVVRAVERKADRYRIIDSPSNVARRLSVIGSNVSGLIVKGI
ncbi:restriction endonuclease [Williamsia sp. 1135]|uniref:restriction endonuclease n=1 Tax=Williamsia sp. 1135 TaxID=1889262 RepID=UPI00143AAE24|nr:restriction endonuclease [Williamsia sp. 1135]